MAGLSRIDLIHAGYLGICILLALIPGAASGGRRPRSPAGLSFTPLRDALDNNGMESESLRSRPGAAWKAWPVLVVYCEGSLIVLYVWQVYYHTAAWRSRDLAGTI